MESKPTTVLKRNSEFLALKRDGQRYWPASWLLFNFRGIPSRQIRFGVTASRKVGTAVVRNRLKRWCREYFRSLSADDLALGVEINVIFKPIDQGFYRGLSHGELRRALERGFETVQRRSAEPGRVDRPGLPGGGS